MKKIMVFVVLGCVLVLSGCATVEVSQPVQTKEQQNISSIYLGTIKCSNIDSAETFKNSLITSLLGYVKIMDSAEKADATIEGSIVMSLDAASSDYVSGYANKSGGGIVGGGSSSQRNFVKSVSLFMKNKEGEIIFSASLGQTMNTIEWGGELSQQQTASTLGKKIKEFFRWTPKK